METRAFLKLATDIRGQTAIQESLVDQVRRKKYIFLPAYMSHARAITFNGNTYFLLLSLYQFSEADTLLHRSEDTLKSVAPHILKRKIKRVLTPLREC